MKGLSVQCCSKSVAAMSSSRGILFVTGMKEAYGSKEVCAQKKGRCNVSEKRLWQDT